jgi:T5SS/PEP-CTERM-associated repeat protein
LETRDLTVGDHGKGELNIKWGGDVKAEKTVIGDHPGSKGEVTVEGRGSKLETKDLTVGDHGRGDLTVKWGGEVKAEKTVIGDHRGSKGEVTVEGRGSKLETKDLTVGKEGKGRLAVTRGGKVEADSVKIGDKSGSKGTVIVAGRGSDLKDKGSLVVGDHGDGYLGIFDGGHVSDKVGIVGAREGSNGDVTMSGEGSAWYNRYFLGVGLNGTGKLTVENGAWVGVGSHDDPGKLLIGSNGTVDVEGDLASAIQANIVNDGGSLVVDPPIEDVSSYTQNSGTTTFEVNGTGLNDYGYIDITDSGLVDITGGTIDIDFSGFTPTPGEQFDFFAGAGYVTVGPDVTITVTGGSGSFIFNPSTGDYTFETPEPGTMTLLPIALIGLMGLMGYKKRNGLLI